MICVGFDNVKLNHWPQPYLLMAEYSFSQSN